PPAIVTVPSTANSEEIGATTVPSWLHLIGLLGFPFTHDAEYFHVPSSEPPQGPPNGHETPLSTRKMANEVKCETCPDTLVPLTVEGTGNHCPLATSSHATTASLVPGGAAGA